MASLHARMNSSNKINIMHSITHTLTMHPKAKKNIINKQQNKKVHNGTTHCHNAQKSEKKKSIL